MAVLLLSFVVWLVTAATAPETGLPLRLLLLVIATLMTIRLIFWHLGGIEYVRRSPGARKFKAAAALVAVATSPVMLYPLGLAAIVGSLFSGGAASPALAMAGVVIFAPVILMSVIALMFALGGYMRR